MKEKTQFVIQSYKWRRKKTTVHCNNLIRQKFGEYCNSDTLENKYPISNTLNKSTNKIDVDDDRQIGMTWCI